ncbi:hypothetical protein GOD61_03590 [Sinorhizobium medicae]|nr:hypothetical protein [Sinorhizobium medicae]
MIRAAMLMFGLAVTVHAADVAWSSSSSGLLPSTVAASMPPQAAESTGATVTAGVTIVVT